MDVQILRPDDLLVVDVTTTGLELSWPGEGAGPDLEDESPTAVLTRVEGSAATITLTLATQAFGEQAFFEAIKDEATKKVVIPVVEPPLHTTPPAGDDPPTRTARRRQGGASRLVFRLRNSVTTVPFTAEGLLAACLEADLLVPETATPPPEPTFSAASPWLTGLLNAPAQTYLSTTSRLARWAQTAAEASAQLPVLRPSQVSGPGDRRFAVLASDVAEAANLSAAQARDIAVSLLLGAVPDSRLDRLRQDKLPSWWTAVSGQPRPPSAGQTAIEAPFRLFLSPHQLSAFVHAVRPVALGGRTELWHSRLAVRPDAAGPVTEDPHWLRTVRAVWARTDSGDVDIDLERDADYSHDPSRPFRMSLDDKDRRDLVVSSADPRFQDIRPVDANLLHVSALGAALDLHGHWTPPGGRGTGIEEWAHRATLGRDNYVRVVYAGHLYPTGHAASLVKVTERRFHDRRKSDKYTEEATAYLRQRMYIVVREPERSYAGTDWLPHVDASQERAWPLARVRIKTLVTPDLDPPERSDVADLGQSLFCPRVGDQDFAWAVTATDVCGNRLELAMPLYFVSVEKEIDRTRANIVDVRADYWTTKRNLVNAGGQRLALAPSTVPGDTELTAKTLVLTSVFLAREPLLAGAPEHGLGWYPKLDRVDAVLPSAAVLTGKRTPVSLQLFEKYLDNGFPARGVTSHDNKGEVFARIVTGTPPLAMSFSRGGSSSAASGGFLSPDLAVQGLSRLTGPVGGTSASSLDGVAKGQFNPKEFLASVLPDVLPKLFGCISLIDLLDAASLDLVGAAGDALNAAVPSFATEALTAVDTLQRDLVQIEREAAAVAAVAGAAVTAALVTARARVGALTADVAALSAARDAAAIEAALAALTGDLTGAAGELSGAVAALDGIPPAAVPLQAVKVLRGLLLQTRDVVADGGALVDTLRSTLLLAEELRVTFSWSTPLTDYSVFVARRDGRPAHLDVRATVQAKTKLHPQPSADVVCGMRDFTLLLVHPAADLISIDFAALEFRARAGAKPDVNVELAGIHFVGCLSFVEALRDLIPLDGFSDPPSLEVSEKGIAAGFSLALPDIPCGVFSLQNLSLGARFTVPFLGDALSVRFNFCERQTPFLLTVMCFGGGGFFAVTMTPDGIKTLEASFEFGAALSMDFGVASGSVSVMGGIYYCIDDTKGALLTGFFTIHGQVEVLGIVSVSLELSLQLAFQPASGKCVGKATLSLSISVGFFEVPVTLECERKFAGSNGDPIFAQLAGPSPGIPQPGPWLAYCAAFAPVPVPA